MIVITVTAPLAHLLHQNSDLRKIDSSQKFLSLTNWLQQHQAKLVPTFPGADDQNLQSFFELHINKEMDETLLSELQKLPGIDGAYNKGDESLPV